MRIQVLLENTTDSPEIKTEHGLSLYIETGTLRILFDMGVSQAFADNAKTMGIDLSEVDFAVISHGHGDHGGGLSTFLNHNETAPVYIQKTAFCPLYHCRADQDTLDVVGLNAELGKHPQVQHIEGDYEINESIHIITGIPHHDPLPRANEGLLMGKEGVLLPDDFIHEQNLLIKEGERSVLLTGCSHNGIVNIVKYFHTQHGTYPDVVVGGFHLILSGDFDAEAKAETEGVGDFLRETSSQYYTGHCTGQAPFQALKHILKDQIHYFRAGQQIDL